MNLRPVTAELLRSSGPAHNAFLMGRWLTARNHWLEEARKHSDQTLRQACLDFARSNHRAFLNQRRLLKRSV